jgi:restriction system protein
MFTHEEAMIPILRHMADGETRKRSSILEAVAEAVHLGAEEREEMLPSGRLPVHISRSGWGLTYLEKAELLQRPKRAHYCITDAGTAILAQGAEALTTRELRDMSAAFDTWYRESILGSKRREDANDSTAEPRRQEQESDSAASPEETLERAHATLKRELAAEILGTLAGCSPAFFEDLVVQLLVKMGYGGSFEDAARSVGKSGDGGIDGIIKEDRLGLDAIYIQAKRWQGNVGRPDVQAFVGALTGHRAKKGVFITTSDYSRDAREYVKNLEAKVVLIDGRTLAEYMIEVGLGVSLVQTYEVRRLDSDFFEE